MTLDMLPSGSSHYVPNGNGVHSKSFCQLVVGNSVGHIQSLYLSYLHFRQNRSWRLFTFRVFLPALCSHISLILFCRRGKQMVRATAGGIVATMANIFPSRDSTKGQFISNSMRSSLLITSCVPNVAVSICGSTHGPLPTLSRFINSAPEFLFEGHTENRNML